MVQTRKERKAAQIPLSQPDRSGPSEKTLLELAQERQLFDQADVRQRKLDKKPIVQDEEEDAEEAEISSTAERILDVMLWSVSLSMLHFTLDVLVQQQYAVELSWIKAITRTLTALFGKTLETYMQLFLWIETESHCLSVFLLDVLPSSAPIFSHPGVWIAGRLPGSVAPGCVLRNQRSLRLLSHIYLEHIQLSSCHEAGPIIGMLMGLECDRNEPATGRPVPGMRGWLPLVRRL
ncbi:hypothetical protein SCAR479_00054 [Seiridium cardinale]|uniref:Uncharacterized protein n=1 Tax=Seiridium cardinale TaxID=138064 RepID=A0ABR2Y8F2_9PEZI